MLDRAWDWVPKQDFMLWFSDPWKCHGTDLFFGTNQSCFQSLTPKESVTKARTGKQGTWIKLYTPMKERSVSVTAATVMVSHDPETQIFATPIIQSSGEQNFNQLQSCSKQLENLNNWLQEGVWNRLVWQVGLAESVWETCCVLKDLPNIALFSEVTFIHVTKTSFLLCVSSSFEFFLFVFVEVSKSNICMLKLLWIIYLPNIFSPQRNAHSFSIKTMSEVRDWVTVN